MLKMEKYMIIPKFPFKVNIYNYSNYLYYKVECVTVSFLQTLYYKSAFLEILSDFYLKSFTLRMDFQEVRSSCTSKLVQKLSHRVHNKMLKLSVTVFCKKIIMHDDYHSALFSCCDEK